MNLSWKIEPEKAEKMAKARALFEAKKWPLFASAGLLAPTSAEQIVANSIDKQAHWDRMQKRLDRKARLMRFLAIRQASTEDIAILERRRLAMPKDPEYSCAFWRARIVERLGGHEWVRYQFPVRQV